MKKTIFEYTDYKPYLNDLFDEKSQETKGYKSKVSAAIGIQLSYLSQVLHRNVHLSLEQAEALNTELGHSHQEAEYFLLLVQHARAGTKNLRERLQQQIKALQEKRFVLKNRVAGTKELSSEDQMTYYSRWIYAALHMAVAVPELNTRDKIAQYLGLDASVAAEALEFLVSKDLVRQEGSTYSIGEARLFLGADSPMIRQHHTNWRMQSLQALERPLHEQLHFSTVVTLSRDDFNKIRENLIRNINEARAVIRESKEEEVAALNLDFFLLKK